MLLHADNFDYYGSDSAFLDDGVYASTYGATIINDPDGVSVGKVLSLRFSGNERGIRWVLPAANATVGVAARFYLEQIPASDDDRPTIIQFRDGANDRILGIRVTPTGALEAIDSGSVVVGATTGPVLTPEAWWHIEAKFNAGTGDIEVRVEGVTVLDDTDPTPLAPTTSQIACGSSGSGNSGSTDVKVKDLVVWDSSGSANNDFFGSVLVYDLAPTADDTFPTGWTSTAANGYSVLDSNPPDDGVAYIAADDTPPAAAVFDLEDLPADVTSVRGLITRVRAAKTDGGDGSLQVSMTSNGSDDAGADRPITTAQTYWSDVSELDPDTAAAWTPSGVNAAQLKIDRTT